MAATTDTDLKELRLDIEGMTCASCVSRVERGLNRLDGVEATVNFRWSVSTHVGVKAYDLYKGIDELFDKLEAKIEKEKTKIKEHHHKKEPATEAE